MASTRRSPPLRCLPFRGDVGVEPERTETSRTDPGAVDESVRAERDQQLDRCHLGRDAVHPVAEAFRDHSGAPHVSASDVVPSSRVTTHRTFEGARTWVRRIVSR